VLLDDLKAAIGPAMALILERLIGVRQQAVAVADVGVMRQPAVLDDRKTRSVSRRWCRRPAAGHAIAARRIRHMVPCTMMALASLRWTMPISKNRHIRRS